MQTTSAPCAHTPTPWKFSKEKDGPQFIITDGKTAHVGGIASVWGENNAAFIVRACNSHDALVSALHDAPGPPNDGDFECKDGGREAENKWWADYSLWLETVRAALSSLSA